MRILIIVFILTLTSCARSTGEVQRILADDGCTDIIDNGADIIFSGCDKNDFYNNQFTCTKNGHTISGVVCSGVFKGFTIRRY